MGGVVVNVNPGICGFDCIINAEQTGKRVAKIMITQSRCALIKKFSELLDDISLKDLFIPVSKNTIFLAAKQAHCHLACPVPVAVVKASEVALGLAVPKDAVICFSKNVL